MYKKESVKELFVGSTAENCSLYFQNEQRNMHPLCSFWKNCRRTCTELAGDKYEAK